MATIQEINSSIIAGNFSNEQLDSILSALRFARGQLVQKNKHILSQGSKVKFVSSRTGQTMIGNVSSIKRKFVHVRVGNTEWRVPGNMLTVCEV